MACRLAQSGSSAKSITLTVVTGAAANWRVSSNHTVVAASGAATLHKS
jgi:hypothetical protein